MNLARNREIFRKNCGFQSSFPSTTCSTNHKASRFSRERGSKEMQGMLHLRSALLLATWLIIGQSKRKIKPHREDRLSGV